MRNYCCRNEKTEFGSRRPSFCHFYKKLQIFHTKLCLGAVEGGEMLAPPSRARTDTPNV